MVLFESPTARTEWLADVRVILLTQTGRNTGESLKRCLDVGAECLARTGSYKWLSDNRHMSVHDQSDAEWVNNDWLPRAVKAGWKKWALIQPSGALSVMSEQLFVESFARGGVEVRIFDTPDEGFRWLASV